MSPLLMRKSSANQEVKSSSLDVEARFLELQTVQVTNPGFIVHNQDSIYLRHRMPCRGRAAR